MIRYLILLAFLNLGLFAQTNNTSTGCSPGLNYKIFDANNIHTKIYSSGDMHFDIFGTGNALYEFPSGSGKTLCNASHIWIGGINSGGQLKLAGQTYRQSGLDFWPGPLSIIDGSIYANDCYKYDYVWKVNTSDIDNFIDNYNNGNVQNGSYTIPNDILSWPVKDTISPNFVTNAPFVDVNHNGKYDPKNEGDYPLIKGDQTLFQIFNDNGNAHSSSGSSPMGLQFNQTVYGYNCEKEIQLYPELLNTTFYHYKIYNRSQYDYHSSYIAFWVDGDIGTRTDDYVGSNPKKAYGFFYNGYNIDAVYGNQTPALGVLLLKAPKAQSFDGVDNDNDSIMDEPGEELLTPRILYFNHSTFTNTVSPSMTDPTNGAQFYQYMSGYWRDGSPYTCGGQAYGGSNPIHSVFTGSNSATNDCSASWTEKTSGNPVGNRCLLVCTGPIYIAAYDSLELEYAMVSSVDSTITNSSFASTLKLQKDVDKVRNFYYSNNKSDCFLEVGIKQLNIENEISVFPNPVESYINIKSDLSNHSKATISITDVLGRELFRNETNHLSQSIDITFLTKGIYLITINVDEHLFVRKIIKN